MDYIYIGKIVNTHGIKGELRIQSEFKYKEDIFKPGIKLYIDNKPYTISSVRNHKNYKLTLFEQFNNINEVLQFKGKDVYASRDNIKNKVLPTDLIGFDIIVGNKNIGKLTDILSNGPQEILVINDIMIPYVEFFIKNIDIENMTIYINEIEGLLK